MNRLPIHLMTLAFLALSGLGRAQEEDFTVERSSVAAPYGQVASLSAALAPLTPGPGRVFRRVLTHQGAQALRVHFQIASGGARGTWAVAVLDSQGDKRWAYSADLLREPDFWSTEIEGSSVTIEVYTVAEAEDVNLTVDRYLVISAPARQESLIGPDQRAPIARQSQRIRDWGRAVARIRFVGDNGVAYFCTGFLVAPELLLTNEHCIHSEAERRSALVDFDYDTAASRAKPYLLSKIVLLQFGLDYGLLRLAKSPDRPPLPLRDVQMTEGETLLIIQHPVGEPKQVSVVDCSIRHTSLAGRDNAETDFGHLCDTLGGSSGSPVQDPRDGAVIGLHHFGFKRGSPRPVNQAVKIGKILQDIQARDRQAFEEISAVRRER